MYHQKSFSSACDREESDRLMWMCGFYVLLRSYEKTHHRGGQFCFAHFDYALSALLVYPNRFALSFAAVQMNRENKRSQINEPVAPYSTYCAHLPGTIASLNPWQKKPTIGLDKAVVHIEIFTQNNTITIQQAENWPNLTSLCLMCSFALIQAFVGGAYQANRALMPQRL